MTKKQRRDKESIAKSHRKKIIVEEDRLIADEACAFRFLRRYRELSTGLAATAKC